MLDLARRRPDLRQRHDRDPSLPESVGNQFPAVAKRKFGNHNRGPPSRRLRRAKENRDRKSEDSDHNSAIFRKQGEHIMKEFEGKVALVTGGGSGIGRATALAFAREGAQVVIGNRNLQRGEETVSMIRKAGGTASFQRTDVLVAAEIEALVDHAVTTYGRLDVAFNNAGIEGDSGPLLVEQTEANYDAVMDVNVKGVWLSMKYEIPRMLKQGGGAIVNCSSVAGLVGFPGFAIYIASKHAVIGLTKTAALEYSAQGIRINAVNPAV